MRYALPPVLDRMKSLGFAVFENGVYNLNLFGIRTPGRVANQFDDMLGCAYRKQEDGPWIVHYWPGTCDPGTYWLENPMNVGGAAILVGNQQCRGAYKVAKHRGQYEALCQRKSVRIYRDRTEDNMLDMDPETTTEGIYGINIHASSRTSDSPAVNKWSAGCQVHGTAAGFEEMMELVALQKRHHPTWETYTYTLLEQWW